MIALRADLLDRRARAHHGAGRSRAAEDASSRIEGVVAEFPDWPDRLAEALVPGLERAYRRGRKRMREAEEEPTTERVHQWRKRAKDHWYHLRLVSDAWPQELEARADEVHRLTDLLGDDHDLAILAGEVQSAGESSDDRADLPAATTAVVPTSRPGVQTGRSGLRGEAEGLPPADGSAARGLARGGDHRLVLRPVLLRTVSGALAIPLGRGRFEVDRELLEQLRDLLGLLDLRRVARVLDQLGLDPGTSE